MERGTAIRYRRDLWRLLPSVKSSVCCEVGVAEGYFSADMLSWGIQTLYMVDMWECSPSMRGDAASPQGWHDANYEAAKLRASKYEGKYQILRGPSARMAQHVQGGTLDLIHIDGDHSYEGVLADLNAWYPKMKSGGIISGHDYLARQYGVKEAVAAFRRAHNIQTAVHVMQEDKDEDAGFYFVVL